MGIGEVGERLRRSTVVVQSGVGSGIAWDASGMIVTKAHVARSSDLTFGLWAGAPRGRFWKDAAAGAIWLFCAAMPAGLNPPCVRVPGVCESGTS